MSNHRPTPAPTGIPVTTSITAGTGDCPTGECSDPNNHAEGVVVASSIVAGEGPIGANHAEGITVASAIVAGEGPQGVNHAEGIVVSTAITAGAKDCTSGNCSDPTNHAEGIVLR